MNSFQTPQCACGILIHRNEQNLETIERMRTGNGNNLSYWSGLTLYAHRLRNVYVVYNIYAMPNSTFITHKKKAQTLYTCQSNPPLSPSRADEGKKTIRAFMFSCFYPDCYLRLFARLHAHPQRETSPAYNVGVTSN